MTSYNSNEWDIISYDGRPGLEEAPAMASMKCLVICGTNFFMLAKTSFLVLVSEDIDLGAGVIFGERRA